MLNIPQQFAIWGSCLGGLSRLFLLCVKTNISDPLATLAMAAASSADAVNSIKQEPIKAQVVSVQSFVWSMTFTDKT